MRGSSKPEDRDKVPETLDNLIRAEHKLVAQINATPAAWASDDHIVVEERKAKLELTLADFLQLGRPVGFALENAGDLKSMKQLNRKYNSLIND